jgi:hypothetical protein
VFYCKKDQFKYLVNVGITLIVSIGIRRGVSKGVEDGRRPPALLMGHKAVSGVARLQGVPFEG